MLVHSSIYPNLLIILSFSEQCQVFSCCFLHFVSLSSILPITDDTCFSVYKHGAAARPRIVSHALLSSCPSGARGRSLSLVIFSTYDFIAERRMRRPVSSFKKHLKSSFAAFCSSPAAVVFLDFYWPPFLSAFEMRFDIIYCLCDSNANYRFVAVAGSSRTVVVTTDADRY